MIMEHILHKKGLQRNRHSICALINCYSLIVLLLLPNLCRCNGRMNDRGHLRIQQDIPSRDIQEASPQDNADQSSYESTGSSDLREDGLPAPNELSVIRLNDTSVVLRWDFPQESQEHLQFFKVQYKSTRKNTEWKTDNQEISTTTRAYQINGLKPGNFYFSVIAVYDNDDNVPSAHFKYKIRARSKIRAEEMPEMKAPVIYWTEAKPDFFRFKWKYEPKGNDTEYYGFLVYYRSAHAVSDFTIYNTLEASVEIAEVDPDTPYEAKVVAYNTVGVSEFSDTITIRTMPRQNSSTTAPNVTTPSSMYEPTTTSSLLSTSTSTTSRPIVYRPSTHGPVTTVLNTSLVTSKPTISPPAHNTTNLYQSFISIFEPIFDDQSDSMLIVRYLLLVLLPVLFIVLILIFLTRPNKSKKDSSPPSSTDESMQFHLEINGYFKNSFPGVEEEYPSIANSKVHNGFVNNHPHIDDFA